MEDGGIVAYMFVAANYTKILNTVRLLKYINTNACAG